MDFGSLAQFLPMLMQTMGQQGQQGQQGMNPMMMQLLNQKQEQKPMPPPPMRPMQMPSQIPPPMGMSSGIEDLVHRFQPGTNPNQTGYSSRNYGLPQESLGQIPPPMGMSSLPPGGMTPPFNPAAQNPVLQPQSPFGQRLTPEMLEQLRMMMMRGQ